MSDILTYSELIKLPTFEERFKYAILNGAVGESTFGFDRYLNQEFYHSSLWRNIRRKVILRDNGCDLAMDGFTIYGHIYVHHLNPITSDDILNQTPFLIDPEYLVCVGFDTHNAITYGSFDLIPKPVVGRAPGDTCPWR